MLSFIQGKFEESATARVLENVRKEIKISVINELVAQVDFVGRAQVQFIERISDLVRSKEFLDAVTEEYIRSGGAQKIILIETQAKAEDREETVQVRAAALELFALFYTSARTVEGIDGLRATFARIVQSAGEETLAPELLSVILRYYPIDDHDPDLGGSECFESVHQCLGHDRTIFDGVLNALDNLGRYDAAPFDEFFQRMPQQFTNRALAWVKERADTEVGRGVLLAMAGSKDLDVIAAVLPSFLEFARSDAPHVRLMGLEALAALDPHVDLDASISWSSARSPLEEPNASGQRRSVFFTYGTRSGLVGPHRTCVTA